MTPGRIEKGSKSGQSIKIMKTECYYNKVIQRLSSREGVGMHLPCLWPDFDILIIDVGIVLCFSRKCPNSGLEPSIFFCDRQCI